MPTTTTPSTNGKPQRKQLSDQLDRLDAMIDTLAEGLPEAVADATREGTRQAIREVLTEVLKDPEVLEVLRASLAPAAARHAPGRSEPQATPSDAKPGAFARLRAALRAAASGIAAATTACGKAVAAKVGSACSATKEKVKGMATGMTHAVRALKSGLPAARIAGAAFGVGIAVAVVSYHAPHGLAAVASGVGAALTTAAILVGGWVRRSLRAVGLGAGG